MIEITINNKPPKKGLKSTLIPPGVSRGFRFGHLVITMRNDRDTDLFVRYKTNERATPSPRPDVKEPLAETRVLRRVSLDRRGVS